MFGQTNSEALFIQQLSKIDSLEATILDDNRNPLNLNKVRAYERKTTNLSLADSKRDSLLMVHGTLSHHYSQLLDILFTIEKEAKAYNATAIQNYSALLISDITDLNKLQRLFMLTDELEPAKDDPNVPVNFHYRIQANLKNAFSEKISMMCNKELCQYSYNTNEKVLIKGVLLSTANDLFSFKNYDMDYTGGVKIGIVTDYLKMNRYRPVKSYQTVFFGADVFTPYFRDTVLFSEDTSYNSFDRPHASFQYIGLETNALSRNYRFRWNITLKLGRIGGNKAKSIQSALHQDLTKSPRPEGWGAQISNKGRLGFSLEYKPEYLLWNRHIHETDKGFSRWYPSVVGDVSWGTYMTHIGTGIQLSNRNFFSSNQDNMSKKKTNVYGKPLEVKKRIDHREF